MKLQLILKDKVVSGTKVSEDTAFMFDEVSMAVDGDRVMIGLWAPVKSYKVIESKDTEEGHLTHIEVEI